MSDRLEDCSVCEGDGTLFRVPSANFITATATKNKSGQIVKDFIKDAKEDLEQEKEKMKEGINK